MSDRWTPERLADFAGEVLPILAACGFNTDDDSMAYQLRRAIIGGMDDNFGVEFRFIGSLGFGGKLHVHPRHFYYPRSERGSDYRCYVSCYPEDWTPERKLVIDKANEQLTELADKYAEDFTTRCVLASGHKGGHVYPRPKPIFDRMKDGEFDREEYPDGFAVPGVSVPANVPRCRSKRKVSAVA